MVPSPMRINERVAFKAMIVFLEEYWRRVGRPDDLSVLLSGLQLCDDGRPMDLAHWSDWMRALETAKANPVRRIEP